MRDRTVVIERQQVDLKERWDDAVYHRGTDRHASLNLKRCEQFAQDLDIDFYEYVARCINHEFLHYLLHFEQNARTCSILDSIAEKYKEYWMW